MNNSAYATDTFFFELCGPSGLSDDESPTKPISCCHVQGRFPGFLFLSLIKTLSHSRAHETACIH